MKKEECRMRIFPPNAAVLFLHSSFFILPSVKTMTDPDKSPLLILISAPSGGGKTTLCHQLLAARPDMTRAITCTTRAPRPGEKDGVDYYFFGPVEFQRRQQI